MHRTTAILLLFGSLFGCAEISGSAPNEASRPSEVAVTPGIATSVAGGVQAGTAIARDSALDAGVVVPPSPFAYANMGPSDDLIVGPPDVRASCEADLQKAGIRYRAASLAVHVEGKKRKITCGAPEVVLYLGSPEKISYSSAPLVTCTLALALAHYETVIQEEAKRTFGKRVKKIDHLGTYSCREMAAYPGWVSEHSYANAIDLAAFTLEDGRTISVLKNFEKTTVAPTNENALFLRSISHRAYDEDIFSNVLTEYFDALHKNHFHLDLSRYRNDGTRPQ